MHNADDNLTCGAVKKRKNSREDEGLARISP
jgi:hypothetical protein